MKNVCRQFFPSEAEMCSCRTLLLSFILMVTCAAAGTFICNQRWQQHDDLPTTSFYFQPHQWKCPDNRAAGRISAPPSSEFMRERGHKSGDDRQECMKARCTEVFNSAHTGKRLRILLYCRILLPQIFCDPAGSLGGKTEFSSGNYHVWLSFCG